MKQAVKDMTKSGKVIPFKDLPVGAQASLAWYMSIDGEGWELAPNLIGKHANTDLTRKNLGKAILNELDFYVQNYGSELFGYVEVDSTELKTSIFSDWALMDSRYKSFEDYNRDFVASECVNHGESVWPVILSGFDDETLQDGWHRIHSYFHKRMEKIPCVWFVEKSK